MRRIGWVLAATSIVTLVASTVVGRAAPRSPCGTTRPAAAGPSSMAAAGRGLEVALGGRLASIVDGEHVQAYAAPAGAGGGDVVRHIASKAGIGTAYIL